MRNRLLFTSLQICTVVFLLSHLLYATLTFPYYWMDKEVWEVSVTFAFGGSLLLAFFPFAVLVYRLCERAREQSFAYFYKALVQRAVCCAAGSAIAVTLFFCLLLHYGHIDALALLMPLAGTVAPIPILLLLRRPLRNVFHELHPAL